MLQTSPSPRQSRPKPKALPRPCVLEGTVATDGEGAGPNSARLRVQLPENWNGKLVFFGVGGLAGSLDPSASPHDFVSALGLGYATAIADTGHVGKSPFDADWVLEAPASRTRPRSSTISTARRIRRRSSPKRSPPGSTALPKSRALISTGARSAATWGSWRRCATPTITTASSPARRIWIITLSFGATERERLPQGPRRSRHRHQGERSCV